jgi:hypothetical protein
VSAVRDATKRARVDAELMASQPVCLGSGAPWHYASIQYGDQLFGLLVETEDEEEARREARELCTSFGDQARLLSVTKVVIQ